MHPEARRGQTLHPIYLTISPRRRHGVSRTPNQETSRTYPKTTISVPYFLFALAFNISYIPDYINLKVLNLKGNVKIPINRKLTRPIVFKNLFLILTGIFHPLILWVLAYIDLLTGIEFLIDRRQTSLQIEEAC